ncbi:MAG TPA: hypothetical protein VH419_04535 [Nocardioidaceae bacterium]|jgi:hypothetical protein
MNTHHTSSSQKPAKSKLARVTLGLGLVASTLALAAGTETSASASSDATTAPASQWSRCFYSAHGYDAWTKKQVGMPRCDLLPAATAPLQLEGSATSSLGVDGACFKNPKYWTVTSKNGTFVCTPNR